METEAAGRSHGDLRARERLEASASIRGHGAVRADRPTQDGVGLAETRAMDNIFIERLWRSVKYEEIYLKDYATVTDLNERLDR